MKKLFPIFIGFFLLFISVGCSSNGAGTYQFTDEKGFDYTLILNPNKTAILGHGSPDHMFNESYGEWDQDGDVIATNVSTTGVWWKTRGGCSNHGTYYSIIYDGYIYGDSEGFKAGSKEYRLPIKKL